jgi:predicted nucleic acid-binding protein
MVRTEAGHRRAVKAFRALLVRRRAIWTSSYVLVETEALLQARIGIPALRDFVESILPLLAVHWVDEALHRKAVERLYREDRRQLSLVDCASFECMKALGLEEYFGFDPDFKKAGFRPFSGLGG